MTATPIEGVRIDEVEQHPDGAMTAYTCFSPAEEAMRDLAQELFGTRT